MVKSPTDDSLHSERFSFCGPLLGKGQDCALIMRSLPEWFGIEGYILSYSNEIDNLPTWLTWDSEQLISEQLSREIITSERPIGFLSVKQHYTATAELYVMGVRREWQRQGVGRELIRKAQEWLKAEGCEYLQVKTLGDSRSDENYAKTRVFYEAMGFRPLEEFNRIWDEQNPCLIMIKRL